MFTKYVLPVIALALLIFAVVEVTGSQKPSAPVKPVIEPPRAPFAETVAGSGLVEPQTENIAIGSALAGVVIDVQVKVGQRVRAGQELFRIDDREKQAELRYRQAALAGAQAELSRLDNQPRSEEIPPAEALVAEAEANVADMEDQLKRTRELASRKILSDQELVTREQAFRMSRARLIKTKADLDLKKAGAWTYDKSVARAAVEQAQALIGQTQTEIERLVVRALVDGEVLQVNVRPGEFVGAPHTQALVVLGNVDRLHVRVDIDEHDIPRFRPNLPARAALRGDPRQTFPLSFQRVEPYVVPKKSLTGDNTERVDTRVLQVIYSIDAREQRLYVGQQLDVFIDSAAMAPSSTPEPVPSAGTTLSTK